jgi:tetratricopeptide (TPR) repeat protein
MRRLVIFIIGVLFLLTLSYSSYKILNSSNFQAILVYDFNNGSSVYTLENENKFDDNFPNITATALPIKYLKARYYLEIDSIETAKKLIHESIKHNPYISAPEALLAYIHLAEKNIDSALFYSKKAFYGISDNNRHRDVYFDTLKEMNDSISLDLAFEKIKDKNSEDHWYGYILTRNDINKKPQKNLLKLFEEMQIRFPNTDTLKLNGIKRFIELGTNRYTSALANSELAKNQFEKNNYVDAAKFYEVAISLDNKQYLYFENAAITYDNLKNYLKAEEYFNKVIYDFKTSDGKSEFFKGLMFVKNNNATSGCEYLEKSARKNYIGVTSGLRAVDVYSQLCRS